MAAVAVGPRELSDVYARPFEAAIRLAGLGGVMASYSAFEGVPIHTSRAVLTDLLRGRMGFTGTVVSDYNGIGWAETRQLVASSPEEVGALGVSAGMDVEAPSPHGYGKALVRAVESGKLSEDQLDESVRRVLRDKFALGLFDNPYVAEDAVEIRTRASEGDELSRRLADESVTLLKNDGGLLPLGRDVAKVAVIGPHADSAMVGFPHCTYPAGVAMIRVAAKLGFFPMPGVGELPEEGCAVLTRELERAQGDVEDYARANHPTVSLAEAIRRLLPDAEVTAVAGSGVLPSNPSEIPAAVTAARDADLVILYIGGKAGWYGDDLTEKEGGDTANIDLPPQQVELVKAVIDLGKPTVAVVAFGRPQGSRRSSTACRPFSPPTMADPTREPRSPTPSSGSPTPAESCRSRCRDTSARCRSTTASTPAAATAEPRRTSTRATSTCRRRRCSPSATASATRPSTTAHWSWRATPSTSAVSSGCP
jgi:beta-xylosidase